MCLCEDGGEVRVGPLHEGEDRLAVAIVKGSDALLQPLGGKGGMRGEGSRGKEGRRGRRERRKD